MSSVSRKKNAELREHMLGLEPGRLFIGR